MLAETYQTKGTKLSSLPEPLIGITNKAVQTNEELFELLPKKRKLIWSLVKLWLLNLDYIFGLITFA